MIRDLARAPHPPHQKPNAQRPCHSRVKHAAAEHVNLPLLVRSDCAPSVQMKTSFERLKFGLGEVSESRGVRRPMRR